MLDRIWLQHLAARLQHRGAAPRHRGQRRGCCQVKGPCRQAASDVDFLAGLWPPALRITSILKDIQRLILKMPEACGCMGHINWFPLDPRRAYHPSPKHRGSVCAPHFDRTCSQSRRFRRFRPSCCAADLEVQVSKSDVEPSERPT